MNQESIAKMAENMANLKNTDAKKRQARLLCAALIVLLRGGAK
jgi:uncharacterized ferredoxin-like protein